MMISEELEEDEAGLSSTDNSPTSPTAPSNKNDSSTATTPNKSFERKNSFLGKLFSSKKKSGAGSSPPGNGGAASKPEIGTFSAQFPPEAVLPPDASYSNAIYTPIRKLPRQQQQDELTPNASSPPPPPSDINTSASAQVRNGPNGNFVIYERGPDVTASSPQRQQPIYSQIQQQQQQQLLPPTSQVYGINNPLRYQYPPVHYSNPPPPMPYRPPPPNPYQPNYRPSPSQQQHQQQATSPYVVKRNDVAMASLASSEPSSTSGSSGPSSLDSQASQLRIRNSNLSATPEKLTLKKDASSALYDDSLVVIERSNHELEQKLQNGKTSSSPSKVVNTLHNRLLHQPPHHVRLNRAVDTIHNRLSQEVIYEVPDSAQEQEEMAAAAAMVTKVAANAKTIKEEEEPVSSASDMPSSAFPSISDLTIADIGGPANQFKSLTAQKLMAGLSFNSIDTLIEVNAAAEARKNLNESTETVDFGVI